MATFDLIEAVAHGRQEIFVRVENMACQIEFNHGLGSAYGRNFTLKVAVLLQIVTWPCLGEHWPSEQSKVA
ncbi:hypothetical protein [Brevundimonas vesicularis]|uniref:hypothetical protein n=1 Tax=Brevundimonas vesicularis TaxID=41276 RepID=UPI0038D42742